MNIEKAKSIPLYKPYLPPEIMAGVEDTFTRRWIGYGKYAMALEKKFTSQWGGFAIATNSCTSALFLTACVLRQSEEDEVIIPAITFVSTGMAFLQAGFRVIVADVDENCLLNVDSVRKNITRHTRAVVSVHLYGQKCKLEELRNLCDQNKIALVEDCAHRIGYADSERVGDYACFSFNTMKELPSGEGGIVWVKNPAVEAQLRSVANVGLQENTLQRSSHLKHLDYNFSEYTGLKFLQNDIIAAITCAQFPFQEKNRVRRAHIFDTYNAWFKQTGLAKPIPRKADDSYLMYVIKMPANLVDPFRSYLADAGIATSYHYPSLAKHPLFSTRERCSTADHIQHELVTLPCYVDMTEEELNSVLDTMDRFRKVR